MNGTAELGTATTELKNWSLHSETAPGQKSVLHPALEKKWNTCLRPLYVNIGLIKMSVKAMDM
jgi:hypothetical protein